MPYVRLTEFLKVRNLKGARIHYLHPPVDEDRYDGVHRRLVRIVSNNCAKSDGVALIAVLIKFDVFIGGVTVKEVKVDYERGVNGASHRVADFVVLHYQAVVVVASVVAAVRNLVRVGLGSWHV